ncbi:hypothetical protein [Leptodesmis sichuanensis]|uniref:hypothetical protein n=1 Tax=Leptodesmis sichuanensis TaxID=2906798 RepID=UPI001F46D4F6|nr:hypothetical protein [Leptodesmis sichuanensis]UIE38902.1 hypothetical protein KIK02_04625 [Leptodesmis sichuanensis A121]
MTQQTFQINGRIIEELLGTLPKNIGKPLWVSGDVIRIAFAINKPLMSKSFYN